jgi:SAM-dependent methyltransferase
MSDLEAASCRVCDSSLIEEQDVTAVHLRRLYERELGAIPAAVQRNFSSTTLFGCKVCGTETFTSPPGDDEFYAWVASSAGYPTVRWEFSWALRQLPTGEPLKLLDLGAGSGNFARMANEQGIQVTCVEANPVVAAALHSKGFETLQSLEEARGLGHSFDVVTAFHILEHVSNPVGMLTEAAGLLAPGGSALVSVPNRERINFSVSEALDFPPHHLHRFGPTGVRRILEAAGLRAVHTQCEPVGDHLAADWLARALVKKELPVRVVRKSIALFGASSRIGRSLSRLGVSGFAVAGIGRKKG